MKSERFEGIYNLKRLMCLLAAEHLSQHMSTPFNKTSK
jgi:hypothetical protein